VTTASKWFRNLEIAGGISLLRVSVIRVHQWSMAERMSATFDLRRHSNITGGSGVDLDLVPGALNTYVAWPSSSARPDRC
jgi:hypothetical protein